LFLGPPGFDVQVPRIGADHPDVALREGFSEEGVGAAGGEGVGGD
jgi:hypothetical protein